MYLLVLLAETGSTGITGQNRRCWCNRIYWANWCDRCRFDRIDWIYRANRRYWCNRIYRQTGRDRCRLDWSNRNDGQTGATGGVHRLNLAAYGRQDQLEQLEGYLQPTEIFIVRILSFTAGSGEGPTPVPLY